jgi:hypothetical protein
MPAQKIVVTESGIESVEVVVKSVSDQIAAGQLTERTALALRLLHEAAKAEYVQPGISTNPPVSYFSSLPGTETEQGSVLGTFMFRCACGRRFCGPWEEARWEAIGHVELRHADKQLKRDPDALESVIAALIVPNPLNSWEQMSAKVEERTLKGTWVDPTQEG